MSSREILAIPLLLIIALFGASCGLSKKPKPLESATLLEIARHYGQGVHSSKVYAAAPPAASPKISPEMLEPEQDYMRPIKLYFSQGNYDQLEKAAREAREGKGRVFGGAWKVMKFYEAVHVALFNDNSGESDWKIYFDALKHWVKAKPQSVSARISLAEAYVAYGRLARGSGYADTVSPDGWRLQAERVALAASILADAAKLSEKDPYWYEEMMCLALDQGWDKAQARELMELGIAFEPDFLHFYREHANYLQPRWYGEQGEVEAYAEEVSNRVGGMEGDKLYFEISGLVACQCDATKEALKGFSWPRIQSGYYALEQLYGLTIYKRNTFASMAYKADDKPAARVAFAAIGENWDQTVWIKRERFDAAKSWATQ